MKIYVKKAKQGEFQGYVYSDDLSIELRLKLKVLDDVELEVSGEYEINIDDASEFMANALLLNVTIEGLHETEVTLDSDAPGIDYEDVNLQLDEKIDWSDYWQDRESSAADAAYEAYRDRAFDESGES